MLCCQAPGQPSPIASHVHAPYLHRWDSFYSAVSALGVQEGLKSLRAGATPARWCIIDDGWQQTEVDPQYRELGAWLY